MSALGQKRTLPFCPFLLRAAEPFSRGIFDVAALSRRANEGLVESEYLWTESTDI